MYRNLQLVESSVFKPSYTAVHGSLLGGPSREHSLVRCRETNDVKYLCTVQSKTKELLSSNYIEHVSKVKRASIVLYVEDYTFYAKQSINVLASKNYEPVPQDSPSTLSTQTYTYEGGKNPEQETEAIGGLFACFVGESSK